MAEKAGKAAPAMAIAGVLVAVPQAHASVKSPAKATTVAERAHTEALVRYTRPASRTYTVRPGDTLSAIAQRFYGNPADWPWLYHVNASKVTNPNLIYVGQELRVPYDPPANAASYAPKHARAVTMSSSATSSSATSSSDTDSSATSSSDTDSSGTSSPGTSSPGPSSRAFRSVLCLRSSCLVSSCLRSPCPRSSWPRSPYLRSSWPRSSWPRSSS